MSDHYFESPNDSKWEIENIMILKTSWIDYRINEYRDTLVKQGATLGANCTVLCGITIGEFAFIGAGWVYVS